MLRGVCMFNLIPSTCVVVLLGQLTHYLNVNALHMLDLADFRIMPGLAIRLQD